MCPLRIILIFLSATLAGFFVLRNLKSQENIMVEAATKEPTTTTDQEFPQNSSKVGGAVTKGFWIFVDMASGKYLWRNLVSSPNPIRVSATKQAD